MYVKKDKRHTMDEEQDTYTFKKEDGRWHIHLPAGVEQGWSKADLEMAKGAHKFLNVLSNGAATLRLYIGGEPKEGCSTLELIEHCNDPQGGAIYLFTPASNQAQASLFWICDLALFVFGDMPEHIYVLRLPLKDKEGFRPENNIIKAEHRGSYHKL